jgi:hypothetical protein
MNKLLGLLLSIALLFTTACKTSKPPIAPDASYSDKKFQRAQEMSMINVPIEIPGADLERTLNNQLPNPLYEDNSLEDNGGDNLMLKVTKRAPIKIVPLSNNLAITVPVTIWVKAGFKVEKFGISISKYEDTEFSIDIKFNTKVSLNPDWGVSTVTSDNGFDWISKPIIRIGGFEIPITKIVERIIDEQQPDIARIIDTQVKGKINLKPYVTQAWQQVQSPILLNQEYRTWLKITPQELQMTPLTNNGPNLKVSIGLKAITETIIGDKPVIDKLLAVPNLKTVPRIADDFEIALVGKISYQEAKKLAFDALKSQVFEFNNGKKKVTVVGLDLYGQGEQIIAAIDLAGSLNAKVFLRGVPVFDPATNNLVLENVEFDVDTKNKLVKLADWLGHGKFLKAMTPYFKISINDQLLEAKKMIQQNLANNKVNDQININGTLTSFVPDKIYVTPTGVEAVLIAKGNLSLLIKGF